jgi:hypothetical protein
MSDLEQYAGSFAAGMKVGVGIPLPNAEVFNDWAVIREISEDLVLLQLSRDHLPVGVTLHVGQILELRGVKEGNNYSCRAIIVSEGSAREFQLRLIGEVVSDELREFYRVDAFLPIRYYITHEQHPEVLEQQWILRRKQRYIRDAARKQNDRESHTDERSTEVTMVHGPGDDVLDVDRDESWDTVVPLAANISGGGMRILTHQGFELGEYVLMEILVPSPRRIIDAVVRVVFANRNYAAGYDQEYYNTGLKFVFIDERDRDSIINHISSVQLKRIRQLREKFMYRQALDFEDEERSRSARGIPWEFLFKKALTWAVMLAIAVTLVNYFRNYAAERPKHEIGETFENAIKTIIEKK